jgi:hypothetical protein
MSYGELKIDTITFTAGGVDTSVSVSGLVQNPTFTGNITTTGTISGDVVRGNTISGDVVRGNTVSGATVTGNTGEFGNLTAVSGVFTTQVSGATVTGNVGLFGTITGGIHTLTSGVFASGTAANPSITFVDDLNTGIYSPGADQVAISTSGTGRLFVDASGNVGVGTSAPARLLSISDLDNATIRLTNTRLAAGLNQLFGSIEFEKLDTSGAGAGVCGSIKVRSATSIASASYMTFSTSDGSNLDVERLRITSDGKLGLGTTAPGSLLELGTSTPNIGLNATTTGALPFGLNFQAVGTTYSSITQSIGSGELAIKAGQPGQNAYFITFGTNDGTERARITADGKLGVGTTSPSAKLQVGAVGVVGGLSPVAYFVSDTNASGDAETEIAIGQSGTSVGSWVALGAGVTSGASPYFFIKARPNAGGNSVERLRIDGSGNVGIGTTSPSYSLDIGASAALNTYSRIQSGGTIYDAANIFSDGTNTAACGLLPASNGVTGGFGIRNSQANPIVFIINSSEKLRITSDGKLGLGTSSPSDLLQVNGGVRITSNSPTLAATDGAVIDWVGATGEARLTAARSGANSSQFGFITYNSGSLVEAVRIDSSGNVGIGTTSPGTYLSIAATATDPTGLEGSAAFSINSSDTPKFQFGVGTATIGYGAWIQNSVGNTNYPLLLQPRGGNVGINTTSPSSQLQVDGEALFRGTGNTNGSLRIRPDGAAVYSQIFFDNAAATSSAQIICYAGTTLYVDSASNGDIYHRTNGTGNHVWTINSGASEAARIDSSGRVGIGTTLKPWSWKVLEVGGANLASSSSGAADSFISANAYYDGSWKYRNTGVARNIYMNTDGIVFRQAASGSADAAITWSEHARIDTNGYLRLSSSSPGIQFNGDTAAANALDDYEEGTWTPNQGAGLTVVGTFSSVGRYTKVGNLVFVSGYVNGSTSVAIAAGGVLCSNLPFTQQAADGAGGNCTNYSINETAGLFATNNSTNLYATSALTASLSIIFGFTYRV